MRNKEGIKLRKVRCKLVLFLIVLLSLCNLDLASVEAATVLKVGYFEKNGFVAEENGEFFGYTVDYLEKIAEYTGWKYEYVYYDSWEKCIRNLENGEIDLFCPMIYSDKRAETIAFTESPVGYASTIMYVETDSDLYYGDIERLNGAKIGTTPNSMQKAHFQEYAAENQITGYDLVDFYTEDDVMKALADGTIDVAVLGSLAYHTDVRVIARFGEQPLYCTSGKNNQELIRTIDSVIKRIQVETPGFVTELENKYYGDQVISTTPLFTRKEVEFINQAEPITIMMRDEFIPFNYKKNGANAGTIIEYLKLVAEKSGLQFNFVMGADTSNLDQYTEQISSEKYLLIRSERALQHSGLDENLITTSSILDMDLGFVKRQSDVYVDKSEAHTIATTYEMEFLAEMIKGKNENYAIKYYDRPQDCLNALVDKEADVAVHYEYGFDYLMQKPLYRENLVKVSGENISNRICIVAPEEEQLLVNILNKTFNYITAAERENIVAREVWENPYKNTFSDTIYEYRYLLVCILIFIGLIAILYAVIMSRLAKLQIEQKEYEILQKKVSQDELTGVFNRNTFFEKARKMIDNTEDNMCIVIMDITNFKVVNDLYGMECGDRLLRQIAKELKKRCEGHEVVLARFTGDHFYMCLKNEVFLKMQFPKRYKTFLKDMDITVTYGVFEIGDNRNVPINIMCDRASLAAHDKERKQIDYIRYYTEEERERIIREQEIENDMEKALESRQFCVYVQPKYDVRAEKIIGGEALVRWKHPQKGMIPPGNFISVFEKNGFIIRLDYYVWEETCRLISEMKNNGVKYYPISINVSRAHFYGNELKCKLEELVEKYHLQPYDLELEITETICAEDTDSIYSRVKELQKAGFKVAMDDFGSGYSSLNMLKEMPLNIIKMDLKFLDGGEDTNKSHNILKTLIILAKNLGLSVVVEGVETREQVEFLKGVGDLCAQGYYFSKPVEWNTYEAMVMGQ